MDFLWPANNRQFQLWSQGLSYPASPREGRAVAARSLAHPASQAAEGVKEGGMTVGRSAKASRNRKPRKPSYPSSSPSPSYRSVTRSQLDRHGARGRGPWASSSVVRPIWSTSTYPLQPTKHLPLFLPLSFPPSPFHVV